MKRQTMLYAVAFALAALFGASREAQGQVRQFEWRRPKSNDGTVIQVRGLYSGTHTAVIGYRQESDFGVLQQTGIEQGLGLAGAKGFWGRFGVQIVHERNDLDNRVAFFSCGASGQMCQTSAVQQILQAGLLWDSDLDQGGEKATAFWDSRVRSAVYARCVLTETVDRNPRRKGCPTNIDAWGANAGVFHTFKASKKGWSDGVPVVHLQVTTWFEDPLHDFDNDKSGLVRDGNITRKTYPDDHHWKLESKAALFGDLNLGLFVNGLDIIDLEPMVFATHVFQRDRNLFPDSFRADLEQRQEGNVGYGMYVRFTIPRHLPIPFTSKQFNLPVTTAITPGFERSIPLVNEWIGSEGDDWRYQRHPSTTWNVFLEFRR